MTNIILTVAIPTYNRLPYLKESLTKIASQCEAYPEIEVLVINNCSTDGTELFVFGNLRCNHPRLRYIRNEMNIGADANFIRCVEEARGKYVWLFGDDEILCKDGIKHVIEALNYYEMGFLLLGNMRDSDPTKDKAYISYSEFMRIEGVRVAIEYGFITRSIFKRDLFDCTVARQYAATRSGHAYATRKRGGVFVLNKPVIRVRQYDRAPIHDMTNANNMWLLQVNYLEFLGVPFWKRARFVWEYTFMGMVFRNLGKVKNFVTCGKMKPNELNPVATTQEQQSGSK
jgi:glycosyltransferase involved in cell wall biosynthesis